MSDILCVTNRTVCKGDFLHRLEKIAAAKPAGIILREKDLPEHQYKELAEQALRICKAHEVPCVLHSFVDVALELGAEAIHLPLPILRKMTKDQKARFQTIGASCHSASDARESQRLGCTYITAGHVFVTDCKKGLPGRGFGFLKDVCRSVSVPVYAIGGISSGNIAMVRSRGVQGACVMSGLMRCEDVAAYLHEFEKGGDGNVL